MLNQRASILIATLIFAWCGVIAQDKLYSNAFPLGDVTLLDGPFKKAQDLNIDHFFKYTVGRLLASYRKVAGLSTAGFSDYSNWDGLNGHVGGHYLSALAIQYAATANIQCKLRLDTMITELKKCQDANGSNPNFVGYLSGIPDGKTIWQSIKNGNPGAIGDGWVPLYNIHKTYAGLRDVYVYGGNETAKTMFLKLCDWGISCWGGLNDSQIQQMLGSEHGGINETYVDAYVISNDTKYLNFAKRLSHTAMLNAWAAGNDNLDGLHANTQMAKVVGFQRYGEVANDNNFNKAANFFWTTVSTKRSIALGGNSEDELFRPASQCTRYLTERNGIETCNSYNMLKLTEGLFRQKPDAKYSDFYERILFNHILSSQNPGHGGYVYFTPTHPRHYRCYSAPDVAMWCCVGTGMENHTKYGQFIYTHSPANDSLFVNLFIASQLNWKAKGVTIRQETKFPDEEQTKLTVSVKSPTPFKMYIRHPYWAAKGEMVVIVGNETYGAQSQPTSYIEINRTWNDGDVVTVVMPMHFSYEQLINVANWYAIKRGPIVLAAKTDSSTASMPGLIANADRFAHSPGGTLLDHNTAPKLTLYTNNLDSYFKTTAEPFVYKAPAIFQNKADTNLLLRPFFRLHNSRYMLYWNAAISTNTIDEQQRHSVACTGIFHSKGKVTFSFGIADPSRRIFIYTLSGKRIAVIPAPSRTTTLHYRNQGVTMKKGMYMIQILSGNNKESKALVVAD